MGLRELVELFSKVSVFVAGDPMTDVYHFGHVDRVSPEAPIPVFVQDSVSRRSGGAANVVANLRAWNVNTGNTFPPYEIWSEKHRYVVGHQHMFRHDQDVNIAADWSGVGQPQSWDALVISDYRKGSLINPQMENHINLFQSAGVPIIIDPKGDDWYRYVGATVVCPNNLELEAFRKHDYCRANPTAYWSVVEKCGPKGIRLHREDKPIADFPAKAQHVFDVTGAGDTVTAIVAATLAAKGTLDQACELANLAAGYVVGEVGTTVCPIVELLELCDA